MERAHLVLVVREDAADRAWGGGLHGRCVPRPRRGVPRPRRAGVARQEGLRAVVLERVRAHGLVGRSAFFFFEVGGCCVCCVYCEMM